MTPWRFAPAGSSLQSPSHTYATLGTFDVSQTARNATGYNTSLQSNYIKVSDIQAGFTWTCNATVPYRVDFHSTSTTSFPPIGSLWWTFGDGGSDMLDDSNPMHTYADASPMTVIIQTWDALNVESNATSNITPCSGGTPFISAMANQSIGPVGSVFHFSGSNTYGTSPGTYTNIFVANSTTGAGPLSNGVLPGQFLRIYYHRRQYDNPPDKR